MKNIRSLSVTEVVERTNLPRSTVYALIQAKRLPTIRLTPRGRFRVIESELEAFIAQHTQSAVKVQQQDQQAARIAVDAAVQPTDDEDRNAFL